MPSAFRDAPSNIFDMQPEHALALLAFYGVRVPARLGVLDILALMYCLACPVLLNRIVVRVGAALPTLRRSG